MKTLSHVVRPASLLLIAGLAACATPPPAQVRGRWKPVNHFGEQPQAIALKPAYVYYAAPMDRTLKALLERWARDSHMTLDYRHDSDFTLYRPVADVRGNDLHAALGQLGALYAPQQVAIAIEADRIVVRRAEASPAASTP
ncbi:MAG TPA: hypothetical protein VFE72_07525 [Lysobacter sp.]|nr:hypothetical protein [Lysobacter sp.]